MFLQKKWVAIKRLKNSCMILIVSSVSNLNALLACLNNVTLTVVATVGHRMFTSVPDKLNAHALLLVVLHLVRSNIQEKSLLLYLINIFKQPNLSLFVQ